MWLLLLISRSDCDCGGVSLLISRSDCDCGGVSLITSEVDDGVSMISTRARLMLIEGDFCRPMALSALRFLEPLKKDVIFIVGVVVLDIV